MEEAQHQEQCGKSMDIKKVATQMRKDILNMAHNCGTMGAHVGGSMSAVDILAVLYTQIMNVDGNMRDRFIMSKAHSVMAQYAALHQVKKITDEEIANAMMPGSFLYKHPCMNVEKGIEFSGGSLGQGLSLGAGTAWALKKSGNAESRVFVLVGDGECNEGSIWEAAASIAQYNLNNLTVIIDCNKLQNDGTTEEVLAFNNMAERWAAFGFETYEIDGHDYTQIIDALSRRSDKPRAIIAHTVKGKGVSFAENVVEWHASYLTDALYEKAMGELEND